MKRKPYLGAAAFLGLLILILDSRRALEGAREGLELCIRTVVPSLFPFFVLSGVLTANLGTFPGLKALGKAFGLRNGAETLLIPALLGGYPVGAQSAAQLYRAGRLDRQSAEKLLAFCSNGGPAFLFGMAGGLFSRPWMAWGLWGIHVLSAWLVARLMPVQVKIPLSEKKAPGPDVLSLALETMGKVCGWVILFRVVIAFLSRWFLWALPLETQVLLIGCLELSNGCCELALISSENTRFVLCAGMLAFGGLCVTMQTASVTGGLSLRYYLRGKALQTLFSLVLSSAVVLGYWYLLPGLLVFFLILPRKRKKSCSIPEKAVV